MFKLLDSTSNRNIVQIFDKDEKQLYATVLAIPNYRQEPSDKPLIQLDVAVRLPKQSRPGSIPATSMGRNSCIRISAPWNWPSGPTKTSLMRDDHEQNMKTRATSATDPDVQGLQKADVTGVNPSGEPVEIPKP